jgi:hypothetical protein
MFSSLKKMAMLYDWQLRRIVAAYASFLSHFLSFGRGDGYKTI